MPKIDGNVQSFCQLKTQRLTIKMLDPPLLLLLLCSGKEAEYCDQFVCLSVCLSVCPREYLWNRWTALHKMFCADPLWPWLGPPLAAFRYVMYFRFYG